MTSPPPRPDAASDVALATIAREWGRIGTVGFGGPPAGAMGVLAATLGAPLGR
ncbi:MAG TPA: hypothetical protein VL961_13560 [Acidimicrobiales bacterium]|nr:hypothetical protein [Acidimicrobiales bacterium]